MTEIDFPYADEMPGETKARITAILDREEFVATRRSIQVPETGDGPDAATASKYGGLPWLAQSEEWPRCRQCEQQLQFFFQINTNDCETAPQPGLIQFFYCINDECPFENKFPPDKVCLGRTVDPAAPGRLASRSEAARDPFAAAPIAGWKQVIDYYPHPGEWEGLGIELPDAESDLLSDWGPMETGDKMGGWPAWVQYPACAVCGTPMQLVFQFDPNETVDYRFGQEYHEHEVESGTGWLFRCAEHAKEIGFRWQCN